MSVEANIERTNLVRTALALEGLTLAWVLIEAAVASGLAVKRAA